jgi:hypothetical protein
VNDHIGGSLCYSCYQRPLWRRVRGLTAAMTSPLTEVRHFSLDDGRGGRRRWYGVVSCRMFVVDVGAGWWWLLIVSPPPPPDVCGFGRSQWQSVVGYVAWWLLSADGGFVDASWWSCSPLPLAHVDLSVAY